MFLPLMADAQRLDLELRQTTGRSLEELRTDWLAHLQSSQPPRQKLRALSLKRTRCGSKRLQTLEAVA